MNSKFIQLYNILLEEINPISNDINILKEEIEQEVGLENASIKQIEDLLNNPELFKQNERLKLKVKKYLNLLKIDKNNDLDHFDTLQSLLENDINLPSSCAKEICINLEDDFDLITIQKLITYLKNRTLDINSYVSKGSCAVFFKMFFVA